MPPDATSWTRERAVLCFETAGQSEQSGYEPHAEWHGAAAAVVAAAAAAATEYGGSSLARIKTSRIIMLAHARCRDWHSVERIISYSGAFICPRAQDSRGAGCGLGLLKRVQSSPSTPFPMTEFASRRPVLATGSEGVRRLDKQRVAGCSPTASRSPIYGREARHTTRASHHSCRRGTIWQVTKPGGCLGYGPRRQRAR